jgi:hypothetical protein
LFSLFTTKRHHSGRHRNQTSFWIGMLMFGLVLLYAIVVVVVARLHLLHLQPASVPVVGTTTSPSKKAITYHENNNNNQQPNSNQGKPRSSVSGLGGVAKPKVFGKVLKRGAAFGTGVKPEPVVILAAGGANQEGGETEGGRGAAAAAAALTPSISSSSSQNHTAQHEQRPEGRSIEQRDPSYDNKDQPPRHPNPNYVLKAYTEPIYQREWDVKPLPPRKYAQASLLQTMEYPQVTSCKRLPEQWPVDDPHNPVEADPFLPWIHDVFPTEDGRYVQFVAQNKRRCRTGRRERPILAKMQPQAALFQHVPIRRIVANATTTRYKIVPYERADPDGVTTRFICRFKRSPGSPLVLSQENNGTETVVETLAIHNFDYDWTGFRKRYKAAFLKDDGGIKSIHTTQLIFRCPVPPQWQESVRLGTTVVNDYATLFVDLVPIRTPPRYGITNRYLAPWFAEFNSKAEQDVFDPDKEWGEDGHLLPLVEDSGRWENVPICLPSLMQYQGQTVEELREAGPPPPLPRFVGDSTAMASIPMRSHVRKHRLVACIWASAGYTTRGERFAINDGQRRLLEWVSHNLNIGFDHFYLYDNSAAFGAGSTSLRDVAEMFGPDRITHIPWPSKVRVHGRGVRV